MATLAIVNPTTLLGKELRESVGSRPALAAPEVRLLSTNEEEVGTLTEVGGAAAVVQRLDDAALDGVDVAFFCGGIEPARPVLEAKPGATTAIVLSFDATVEDGRPVVAGVNTGAAERGAVLLSPHPAAVLLAHLLHPLRGPGVEEAVAVVVQPTSMYGEPGLDELFRQTREILAMTSRTPSPIFGRQLAFNLLPVKAAVEPVAAQLRAVLRDEPVVSLDVVQGGVFHSMSASLYVRSPGDPGIKVVRKALGGHPYVELADNPRHLGPIEAAAQEKVLVGAVRQETGGAGGYWLWAVMDNLTRGGALNALEIAEAVL